MGLFEAVGDNGGDDVVDEDGFDNVGDENAAHYVGCGVETHDV